MCRRFFIVGAEGLTNFTVARHTVGWFVYSMFFSSVGIISDHVARRVQVLDRQKVANRVRKASEAYKRRESTLELQRLAEAEARKKASALKQYDYKGGVAGGGGSKTYMGAMEISAQDVEEKIKAAQDRKDELKSMSQSALKAAFASGDPVRMASLVQCACGWVSRGKHTAAHKKSVHHLKWRWTENDRAGLELCGQQLGGGSCQQVLITADRKTVEAHRAKCKAKAAKGGAEDADEADVEE
jgi:hypothetical protein